MAALSPFGTISGAYSATWDGSNVGQVQVGGYRHRYSYDMKPITYDSVGTAPVDNLFMGLAMFVDFVCMEYKADALTTRRMAWPFDSGSLAGGNRGSVEAAGFSIWKRAKPLILSACNPTQVDPRVIIFPKTFLAPGFEVSLDHSGTTERVVPMRLIVFPVSTTDAYGSMHAYDTINSMPTATPYSALTTLVNSLLPPQGCSGTIYFVETLNT